MGIYENSLAQNKLENFHEFMPAYTNISTNNILATKDYTYHNLKDLIRDKDLVLLNGGKDSNVVVINRTDYNNIMQNLMEKKDNGIKNKIYEETADSKYSKL